jgi:hypothetical protein
MRGCDQRSIHGWRVRIEEHLAGGVPSVRACWQRGARMARISSRLVGLHQRVVMGVGAAQRMARLRRTLNAGRKPKSRKGPKRCGAPSRIPILVT